MTGSRIDRVLERALAGLRRLPAAALQELGLGLHRATDVIGGYQALAQTGVLPAVQAWATAGSPG